MTTKRALIVDDSKSARFALKRMLNENKLEVDTVESAIDALDYLERHQPDVIFMDHMMPGMDGFEAVKRIKDNPQTAVIPIMMYTSKDGDVYLSQARALGAVGIIRKTIAPVELKESLLELKLIDDTPAKSTLKVDKPDTDKIDKKDNKKDIKEKPAKKRNVLDVYIEDLRKLMDDQTIELHRSMWLGIESVSNEIFNRLNSKIDEKFDEIKVNPQEITSASIPEDKNKRRWPVYTVSLLLFLSFIINVILLSDINQLEHRLVISSEQHKVSPKKHLVFEEIVAENIQNKRDFIQLDYDKNIEYPHDELALNDNRLPEIEKLITNALEARFTGRIIIQTHAGEFCFSSDNYGSYKLADNNLPVTDCEYLGNHIQPNDDPSSHQSLSFANYLAESDFLRDKGIVIEVTNVARKIELSEYPKQNPQTTAEKWNQAAQLNNRIIVKLVPEPVDLL